MTLAYLIAWFIFACLMAVIGAHFAAGPLLLASRLIDNLRAAIRCAGMCWTAAEDEWRRQWESCQHWARRER